jgi:hypothetical protein
MYGPCLSTILAGHPLRSATRHSLGEPLPHQQADRPQAPPSPDSYVLYSHSVRENPYINIYVELLRTKCETMQYYPRFRKAILQCRVGSHVLLSRSPLVRCKHRTRSTCMPKARRQRSSWARIKPSKKLTFLPHSDCQCT